MIVKWLNHTGGTMDEFRIGYTVGGQRKEIEFKPDRGHAAPFNFVRAIVMTENPGYQFGVKTAEVVLKENGINDVTHSPLG